MGWNHQLGSFLPAAQSIFALMPFRKEASRLRRTSSYKTIQNDGYFWGVSAAEIMINFGAIFAPAVIPECGKRADVQQADIFISHTWSSGRWAKYLAMCMHLNLGKAVFASIFSWLLMILIMAGRSGIGGLGGSRLLLPCWVYGPMAVFFVAFFFGHKFFEPSRVYWFDKLYVDQTDEALKRQQVPRSLILGSKNKTTFQFYNSGERTY